MIISGTESTMCTAISCSAVVFTVTTAGVFLIFLVKSSSQTCMPHRCALTNPGTRLTLRFLLP